MTYRSLRVQFLGSLFNEREYNGVSAIKVSSLVNVNSTGDIGKSCFGVWNWSRFLITFATNFCFAKLILPSSHNVLLPSSIYTKSVKDIPLLRLFYILIFFLKKYDKLLMNILTSKVQLVVQHS